MNPTSAARVRLFGALHAVAHHKARLTLSELTGRTPARALHLRGRIAEIHYITIQGVESWPPEPGQVWNGKDIRDGIRLVQLVNTRSYCNQITVVDVRNHDGRISNSEPHLAMYAQVDQSRLTTIKFGRLPMPDGDYVVLPERKLRHMDQYVATHNGRLAGISEWIELRRDDLHFSNY